MQVIIEKHAERSLAEAARAAYVGAQQIVDQVWERIFGEPVQPAAEEAYFVTEDGNLWAVAFVDPSLDEARVGSSVERLYDCGD